MARRPRSSPPRLRGGGSRPPGARASRCGSNCPARGPARCCTLVCGGRAHRGRAGRARRSAAHSARSSAPRSRPAACALLPAALHNQGMTGYTAIREGGPDGALHVLAYEKCATCAAHQPGQCRPGSPALLTRPSLSCRRSAPHDDAAWPPRFHKLVLTLDDGTCLAYCDARRFGKVRPDVRGRPPRSPPSLPLVLEPPWPCPATPRRPRASLACLRAPSTPGGGRRRRSSSSTATPRPARL